MSRKIATMAMAVVFAVTAVAPSAQAAPGRSSGFNGRGNNHDAYNGGHHGRGQWHNGQWIALEVLGAVAAAAAANSADCYYRGGRRYCD